jgi:Ni/Co efflux regulator RcnB
MHVRKLALAAVAIAATVAAASVEAHGRDDVQLSVTIGGPAWSVPSVPVYRAHGPAFVVPRYYGHPAYRSAPTRWDRDGDGIPNRYDRHDNVRHGHDGRDGRW